MSPSFTNVHEAAAWLEALVLDGKTLLWLHRFDLVASQVWILIKHQNSRGTESEVIIHMEAAEQRRQEDFHGRSSLAFS